MRSRTDGAPTLPINDETDLGIEALAKQLMIERGLSAPEAMRVARAMAAQNAAAPAPNSLPERPDLSGVDVLACEEPGTRRVWNERTGEYETVGEAAKPPEPNPELGARWGGGRPFASQAESDAYYERPTLSDAERREMVASGATPEEIAEAEASQYDIDARQAGSATHGGYAPVWVNGRVQMLPRAPTPLQPLDTVTQGHGTANPIDPGSSDTAAAYRFAQDMLDSSVDEQLPIPLGDDGKPVASTIRPGTANAATGNASTGARAKNRDVPPSLQRPDLVDRGFQPVFMEGPNGGEWVYSLPPSAVQANRERSQANTRARMAAQAGYDTDPGADKVSDQRLRELIREKRQAEKQQKDLLWRPRTMAQAGNAVGAAALPGITDWQLQMLAGGPTPLAVDAVGAQNAMRMMNAEALAGMDPFKRNMQEQVLDEKKRQSDPAYAAAADIKAGKVDSPAVLTEVDRLATLGDTSPGGFSLQNELDLAARLQQPPYSMSQADAEAAAYRAAEKKRWIWNQGGGQAGGQRPADPRAAGAPAGTPRPRTWWDWWNVADV